MKILLDENKKFFKGNMHCHSVLSDGHLTTAELKEKYKGKIGFIGGWEWQNQMPRNYPEYDEEEVRQGVRDAIDKYAPGGGYGIITWPLSYEGDPVLPEIKRILRDECHWYGRKIYGYKD